MVGRIFRGVILGAPGSGKGTIAKRIAERYGFAHISPGDILRLNVLHNTELGKKVKTFLNQGQLVPDEIVIKSVLGRITEVGNTSWILDGFPRTLLQAESLHKWEPVNAVVNLQVPHEVIIARIKDRWVHVPSGRTYNLGFNEPKVAGKDDITGDSLVQRTDDSPSIVAQRLLVYEDDVRPIIDYYVCLRLIQDFCGRTTAEIWPKISTFVESKIKS